MYFTLQSTFYRFLLPSFSKSCKSAARSCPAHSGEGRSHSYAKVKNSRTNGSGLIPLTIDSHILWFLTYMGTVGVNPKLRSEFEIVSKKLGMCGHHISKGVLGKMVALQREINTVS